MRAVDYAESAMNDLTQIWTWVAQRSGPRVADGLRAKIEDKLARVIAEHPAAGRLRPEFESDVRSFPIPPYVVFYRHSGRHERILRVKHGHRDIQEPLMSLLTAAS